MVLLAAAATGRNDCAGKVGDYEYDLTELAQRIGGVDLQATDPTGNTYYYRVCGVVGDNFCQTVDDLMPAVCQKDTSVQPFEYHDCGDQRTAWFGRLPGGHEYDGFTSPLYRWPGRTWDQHLLPMVRHPPLLHQFPYLMRSGGGV